MAPLSPLHFLIEYRPVIGVSFVGQSTQRLTIGSAIHYRLLMEGWMVMSRRVTQHRHCQLMAQCLLIVFCFVFLLLLFCFVFCWLRFRVGWTLAWCGAASCQFWLLSLIFPRLPCLQLVPEAFPVIWIFISISLHVFMSVYVCVCVCVCVGGWWNDWWNWHWNGGGRLNCCSSLGGLRVSASGGASGAAGTRFHFGHLQYLQF